MQVAGSVSEDALYLLFAELEKGLEEGVRRPGAAAVLTHFCATSKLDYQEHVPSLLTVCHCLTSLAFPALSLAPPASYPFVLRTFLRCSCWAIVSQALSLEMFFAPPGWCSLVALLQYACTSSDVVLSTNSNDVTCALDRIGLHSGNANHALQSSAWLCMLQSMTQRNLEVLSYNSCASHAHN